MSPNALAGDDGREDTTMADRPRLPPEEREDSSDDGETVRGDDRDEAGVADILEQERRAAGTPVGNGTLGHRYRLVVEGSAGSESGTEAAGSESGSVDAVPRRAGSPVDSLLSTPDDAPSSVQGSGISSPSSSILRTAASRHGGATPSFRPFDRRFQSRIASPSSLLSSRPSSPALVPGHSRTASLSSQLLDPNDADASSAPWEVVRWTKLRKLNGQAFSETGRRNFGSPTCVAVGASLVFGTSKGIILMFDYHQNLKLIIGPGTRAVESGPITSIAVSADHSTVAGGHAGGSIFTWDTSRPSRPFLSIPPLEPSQRSSADGHVPRVAITHLGFLGTRHTALVSADDRGMAFSHLATRGTGALGRTVKTTRILGRYPNARPPGGKPLKPSTVLAFAPLPLGNVERATDTLGLTAMLTPYLLVVVSTTPVAQTQHKSARPKEVAAHGAMTGCLAWFPAVRLKVADAATGSHLSPAKLAYCWSDVLSVLDVDETPHPDDRDKPAQLRFRARSRWTCDEAIVAVQWLTRSVLTVLTITQRLVVLEDRTMRMTEASDLVHRHIYHADLFSRQLHALVEQLDEQDPAMHGVVADAFYMSFQTYKGRLFLLGFNDVSIGALSNWADRLIALMEHGDYVGAIRLATSYYTGDADKLTVGLPEDASLRHAMVRDKLVEIMSASLRYAFGQKEAAAAAAAAAAADSNSHPPKLHDLAEACFAACADAGDVAFLFDEVYGWYEDAGVPGLFLDILEPYILDGTVSAVPPVVVKALVAHFVGAGLESRLEEMICHMDTASLDLDQTTALCREHGLYDALLYVWNQALGDYITPLIDLLTLLVPLMSGDNNNNNDTITRDGSREANITKIFPYLSHVLTGRVYPTEDRLPDDVATKAKAELYWFLFSGKSIGWPRGSRKFLTRPRHAQEPSFPYLRMILKFDAPSFLSALNEAFEDPFLNHQQQQEPESDVDVDAPEEQIFGLTVDRQYIVSILTEILNPADFAPHDTVYLDMFIARNLPKYPQYLLFPGSVLTRVLSGLARYPGDDLAEDAQLSAEYLLSAYQPPDMAALLPLFRQAGFFRILKRTYRVDRQYGKLVDTYFEDPDDRRAVFGCVADCLRPQTGLSKRQARDVHQVVRDHALEFVGLDPREAARTLASYAPELHRHVLDAAAGEPELQYAYLGTLLEPEEEDASQNTRSPHRDLVEQYVQLMCRFDPSHVSEYVGLVQAGANLRLDKLLPTMEEAGVIDAAVVLMAREGQVQEAMDRLVAHLGTLEAALQGLLGGGDDVVDDDDDDGDLQSSAEELIRALQKYTYVGVWLCQGQTRSVRERGPARRRQKIIPATPPADEFGPDEALWLSLIETCVQITRRVSASLESRSPRTNGAKHDSSTQNLPDKEKLLTLLRSIVQHTFTALLSSTSGAPTQPGAGAKDNRKPPPANLTFLRILRAFLSRAATASPSLADLRSVLSTIFAAYAYEESILQLSNRLLDRSLFVSVSEAVELRQRGWRPRGSTCEACGRRVWGPGVAGNVFGAWEEREAAEARRRDEKKAVAVQSSSSSSSSGLRSPATRENGKGKGKEIDGPPPPEPPPPLQPPSGEDGRRPSNGAVPSGMAAASSSSPGPVADARKEALGPLVVLACRHIYHQSCLDALQAGGEGERASGKEGGGYRCPIDG